MFVYLVPHGECVRPIALLKPLASHAAVFSFAVLGSAAVKPAVVCLLVDRLGGLFESCECGVGVGWVWLQCGEVWGQCGGRCGVRVEKGPTRGWRGAGVVGAGLARVGVGLAWSVRGSRTAYLSRTEQIVSPVLVKRLMHSAELHPAHA